MTAASDMNDAWVELVAPIIARLTSEWQREEEVVRGLSLPNMRLFAAAQHHSIERRSRFFRRGYWMRLRQVPARAEEG